ncbi:hypothetical protein [Pseudomonas sp. DP16D-R1]|jgi:hypothetical protein|uniref:hypothetical protein n=1 Tax=Pseudomonas sp. DP16D-R1 TaxID=2075551 RepID=UPI000CD0A9E5|nr:hypothetical protein [Pseudomonas sp. DP16D-R1]POA78594.1 hypothetical protein C1890_09665 [Pseudomonas sp. DP16D-R1]
MRGKYYRMTLLVALGIFPGIALAAPGGLQNMADNLDGLMSFISTVMGPMVLLAIIVFMFSGRSGQSVERNASAETSASLPSSVGQLQETADGPDPVAITKADRLEPNQAEPPRRVGRKLHLD